MGKTTTALNRGAGLARRGAEVLLIDMDPQAHLSAIHHNMPTETAQSLFAHYLSNTPLSLLEREWKNIGKIIHAHAELIKVDSQFGKGPHILNKLHQALSDREQETPPRTVLMDCCPFLGVLSLNALFAADRIIVPVSSDFLSMRGALQIDKTLRALEPVLKRRLERRYLLTRFDRRRRMSFEIHERLKEQFGTDVCATVISENVAVAEAPALGKDIFSHAAASRGAEDYLALIEELEKAAFLDRQGGRS